MSVKKKNLKSWLKYDVLKLYIVITFILCWLVLVLIMFSKESYHSTNKALQSKKSSTHWLGYSSAFPHPAPPAAVKAQPSSTAGFRCTIGDRESTNTLSGATGQHKQTGSPLKGCLQQVSCMDPTCDFLDVFTIRHSFFPTMPSLIHYTNSNLGGKLFRG